jgi:hypothetical protein
MLVPPRTVFLGIPAAADLLFDPYRSGAWRARKRGLMLQTV